MKKVLHLDDDGVVLMRTAQLFSRVSENFLYQSAKSIDAFWNAFRKENVDCILLDMVVDNDEYAGKNILKELRKVGFTSAILMMSSLDDIANIRECVALGATDFITKGAEESELLLRVEQALVTYKKNNDSAREVLNQFAGETMRQIFYKMPRIIDSAVKSVLVTGESGTGKEVVANSLKISLETFLPFVAVNCATINKDLLESELFGHEKGAFTGAQTQKSGLFAAAHGGWIFLDEVARLSSACQAALLRTLENGEIRPVGSSNSKKVNVRVLAATNEDLDALVEKGEFRDDLLQRLRSYEVFLPPLRERMDEVEEILEALLERLNKQSRKNFKLVPVVKSLFLTYDWSRGNVREMWQVLQAASVEADRGIITIGCLPRSFASAATQGSLVKSDSSNTLSLVEREEDLFVTILNEIKTHMPQALSSQRKLAEVLGISRHALCVRVDKLTNRQKSPEWILPLFATEK